MVRALVLSVVTILISCDSSDNLDTWKPYGWHVFTYKKGVLYCNYVFYYHTNEYLRIYKMDAMKIDFLNI